MELIFSFIGQIVVFSGGAVVIAFLFFRFLGSQWIENKFAKNLEEYRGAQARELEEVKSKISLLLSRTLKLHDKEYEVLPEVWSRVNDAHISLQRCLMSFREVPDFKKMPDDDFQNFLKSSNFSEGQKDRLSRSQDRNQCYTEILNWKDINDANTAFNGFHDYLLKNRIFLSPDLKAKFDAIDDLIWKAWVSNRVGENSKEYKMKIEAYEMCKKSIEPLMKEIESLVQSKLFPTHPDRGIISDNRKTAA